MRVIHEDLVHKAKIVFFKIHLGFLECLILLDVKILVIEDVVVKGCCEKLPPQNNRVWLIFHLYCRDVQQL